MYGTFVIDALKKWYKYQWCQEQVTGIPITKPNNLVFCYNDGSIRGYDAIRRMFDKFTTKYGFRQEFGIHCHMLRQIFSNMQIEANRNIKKVQHLLGHKDAKTTHLHYNSVVDQELDEEGANLIDSLFNKETLQNKDLDNGETYIEKDMPAYHIDTNEQPKNLERVTNLEVNNTNSDDQELEELEELERLIEEKKRRLRLKKEKDFEM